MYDEGDDTPSVGIKTKVVTYATKTALAYVFSPLLIRKHPLDEENWFSNFGELGNEERILNYCSKLHRSMVYLLIKVDI